MLGRRRVRRIAAFTLGISLALGILLAAGETYLRLFPPDDFKQYLGNDSPLTGPYVPDPAFAAQYRSWDAFKQINYDRLWPYLQYIEGSWKPKTWAFFGNSFVQAQGMLADTARFSISQRLIFNLGRNEPLHVRLAQVQLLLDNGFRPERVFVALLPIDLVSLGQQGLQSIHVTDRGALTFRPRDPGGLAGWFVRNTRLGLIGWVRTKQHYANPGFRGNDLMRGIDPPLLADVEHLFRSLNDACSRHSVPVTVVLIPNHEQIAKGAAFGFQDTLTRKFIELGIDVCDVRQPFLSYADKKALFIPDKHFSKLGNEILLAEIMRHLRAQGADPASIDAGAAGP